MFFVMMVSMSDTKEQKKKSWKDKDMMFMTDADAERLLEQWEVWPLRCILRSNKIRSLSLCNCYINKTKATRTNFLINVIS